MAIAVDASTRFQLIDGFGVSQYTPIAYTAAYSAVADSLWHPTLGIGASIYNCSIAVDGSGNVGPHYQNNTFSADIVGDWSQEQAAWNRGCRIFCVRVWTYQFAAPFTWQVGSTQNGAINVSDYTNASNAIATFFENAANNGVYFSYVAPWNEPDVTGIPYPQATWTTAQMLAFIKVLGPILQTWANTAAGRRWQAVTGLSVPQILWGEPFDFADAVSTWIPAAEGDATALSYVGIYANHQYNGGGVSGPPTPCSRKRWMTECSTQGGTWDPSMNDAMTVMGYMFAALSAPVNINSWWFWWAEADNQETDNEGLLGFVTEDVGHWDAPDYTKRFYCFGNFSKFVRPGSQRCSATGAPAGVDVLSFVNVDGRPIVICRNNNASPTAINVNLTGWSLSASKVAAWTTDASNNLIAQGLVNAPGNSFAYTLSATSMTTFQGPVPTLSRWLGNS